MAIFRNLVATFLLSALAIAQPDGAKEEAAIPPLPPPVDLPPAISRDTGEPDFVVVAPDEDASINPGFFTDTSASKGLPRHFNALDMAGYLRMRTAYFRNPHLGTYIPSLKRGTSLFLPNLSLVGLDPNTDESPNPAQNIFSANMRLRLDPTLNVSQMIRVRTTVDIFDNMAMGSNLSGKDEVKSYINVKRAFGEATFPIGELRFGRQPFHWGLGIVYNSGDDVSSDYGDEIDGILFTTRIFDHSFTSGYSIANVGPVARGGGQTTLSSHYLPSEMGQRYPLESGALEHVFMLSLLKRDSDFIAGQKRAEGRSIFDYGVLTSYRQQSLDVFAHELNGFPLEELVKGVVKREKKIGLASFWAAFSHKTFHVETEMAGIFGKYQIGEKNADPMAKNGDGTFIDKRDIWLLQGGAALESRYGFLNDRLQVGLNTGWASSQKGPGFGIRENINSNPLPGDADGRKLPEAGKYKTNFKFNPAYQVDLLLHKEILGTVASTVYLKPHLSYFFSQNFGLRSDVIVSIAPNKSNTPGDSNWLGTEFDASAFLRTDSGFYFSLAYGLLVPLKGLDHRQSSRISAQEYKTYGTASSAQTLQLFLGLMF